MGSGSDIIERGRAFRLRKKFTLTIVFLTFVTALYSLTSDPGDAYNNDSDLIQYQTTRQLREVSGEVDNKEEPVSTFKVCGRSASSQLTSSPEMIRKYASCPKEFDPKTPTLILENVETWGRTGNQLRSFLRAVQYTRDHNYQLAILYDSWAMELLLQYFMANTGKDDWQSHIERTLCVKIFHSPDELRDWNVILKSCRDLFEYRGPTPQEEYVESQMFTLQTLFQHYNTGEGQDNQGEPVRDMCSGIEPFFGKDGGRSSEKYSVIHLRSMEKADHVLKRIATFTGCDPYGAMRMDVPYVKSILKETDMMNHKVLVITDDQKPYMYQRLMGNKDIGDNVHVVPKDASWIGGDITLAIMADVFIGNPASTFSLFIAEARVALGFSNNMLNRAKDNKGKWYTTCGDECLFQGGKVASNPSSDKPEECGNNCIAVLKRKGRRPKVNYWSTGNWHATHKETDDGRPRKVFPKQERISREQLIASHENKVADKSAEWQ